MPLFSRSGRSVLGTTVGTGVRTTRRLFRGSVNGGMWMGRRFGRARARSAGGEVGMVRLFDLHAVSCAGDTLIAIGLAGTIFFNVPLGEARSKVAIYLLVTMVPFAMLAPVVGPLLDHFRHGRRYALAATMLGRAFLAWMISDYIHGFGLYPAAFGVLALSRAYGVARSAAVPRLLPEGLGLSQVGARASVYGTIAGGLVAPIGLAAFWFGPQWPLRVASLIFLAGIVIALRLPPRADSEPPERVPRPLRRAFGRNGERPLGRGRPAGRLVLATLIGAATLRSVYGFLLLFLAFAIKAGDLPTVVLGRDLGDEAALGLVGAALAVGTFLATAVGTRLRIHHPALIQSSGMVIVAGVAVFATIRFSLEMVAALCLVAALSSGIAKLAVDASIQERIPERLRASSFAHSETALMLAFVAGGGLGLVPFDGRIGIGVAAAAGTLAAVRGMLVTNRLRGERLRGRPLGDEELTDATDPPASGPAPSGATDPSGPAATPPPEPVPAGSTAPPNGPASTASPPGGTAAPAPPPLAPARPPASTPPPARPPAPTAPEDERLVPPGFHLYRPSPAADRSEGEDRQDSQGPVA
ncbi:MFS transporter [Micromonospora echinospora]